MKQDSCQMYCDNKNKDVTIVYNLNDHGDGYLQQGLNRCTEQRKGTCTYCTMVDKMSTVSNKHWKKYHFREP